MATAQKLKGLGAFNACDIADALLKLKVPGAGFLPNLVHYAPSGVTSDKLSLLPKVVAPASTVLCVSKDSDPNESAEYQGIRESNVPSDVHWVDQTQPDTFVVMSQPAHHRCAVLGGIMALRMKTLRAKGILVDGRIRDRTELKRIHIPIWAKATSTVGSGLEAKTWALNVPITVNGITINPGDIIFSDPCEGVVVIPQDKLDAVKELLPKLTKADGKVIEEIEAGMSVKEAFAKHRGNL